ncbi:unnamed protein product [Trichobilharzia szidati]|nr:unnamed protein product [Trichobilharzia szidati]
MISSMKLPPILTKDKSEQNKQRNTNNPCICKANYTLLYTQLNKQKITLPPKRKTITYNILKENVKRSIKNGRYSDAITVARSQEVQSGFNTSEEADHAEEMFIPERYSSSTEKEDNSCQESQLSPFISEYDIELQRKEYEEGFLIKSMPSTRCKKGSNYDLKMLFTYITVANEQATLICLLTVNNIIRKLSSESIQALEKSNAMIILLNFLEYNKITIQLATLKIFRHLFETLYFRRLSLHYGIVDILIVLITYTNNDEIVYKTAELLASLCILKESYHLFSNIKTIKCLTNLLNKTQYHLMKNHNICQNIKSRCLNESKFKKSEGHFTGGFYNVHYQLTELLVFILSKLSEDKRNRELISNSNILHCLTMLIKLDGEELTVPILKLLENCSMDLKFCKLIVEEEDGILVKYAINCLQSRSIYVEIQSLQCLYHLMKNHKVTATHLNSSNFQHTLYSKLNVQFENLVQLIQSGYLNSADNELDDDEEILVSENENSSESDEYLKRRGEMTTLHNSFIYKSNLFTKSSTKQMIILYSLHAILVVISRYLDRDLNSVKHQSFLDLIISIVNLILPYMLIYKLPKSPLSLHLHKFVLLEKIMSSALQCLSALIQPEDISQCLKLKSNVVGEIIQLLKHPSIEIVISTLNAVKSMSQNTYLLKLCTQNSGFRYIYSHCFHKNPYVQKIALWTTYYCLNRVENRYELIQPIRSSLGYLVKSLLRLSQKLIDTTLTNSKDIEELVYAHCSVINEICFTTIGRNILEDYGFMLLNIKLLQIVNCEKLKCSLIQLIRHFYAQAKTLELFRDEENLSVIIECLRKGSLELRSRAVEILELLSNDKIICANLRLRNILSILMKTELNKLSESSQISLNSLIKRLNCKKHFSTSEHRL